MTELSENPEIDYNCCDSADVSILRTSVRKPSPQDVVSCRSPQSAWPHPLSMNSASAMFAELGQALGRGERIAANDIRERQRIATAAEKVQAMDHGERSTNGNSKGRSWAVPAVGSSKP